MVVIPTNVFTFNNLRGARLPPASYAPAEITHPFSAGHIVTLKLSRVASNIDS